MTVALKETVEMSGAVRGGLRPWWAFGICAALLVTTTAMAWVLQRSIYLDRDPVPLHKELGRLDKAQLAPYRFARSYALSDEVVETLGTHEYIQWLVEDPRRQANDPLRYAMLFITYYTGGRTQVPHTPERCFIGANFTLQKSWPMHFAVPDLQDGPAREVSAKALVFSKTGLVDLQQQTVVYTFYANCDYASERNYIRVSLMKPGIPKAFFSKVEVSYSSGGMGGATVDPQKAAQAAQELLQTVLPVLMREHWPRPDELTAKKAPAVP